MRSHVSRRPWRPPPLARAFAPSRHGFLPLAAAYELLLPIARAPRCHAPPLGAITDRFPARSARAVGGGTDEPCPVGPAAGSPQGFTIATAMNATRANVTRKAVVDRSPGRTGTAVGR